MWYIIIGLIIFAILYSIFETLSELVGGAGILITIIVVCIVSFFAFSWKGVLAVIGIVVVIGLITVLISGIKETISRHDKERKEVARIEKEMQESREMHENEMALKRELDRNCRQLGHMNEEKWRAKLPTYFEKKYETSFVDITNKFAHQMEEQNITQNDDWFQPFLTYLIRNCLGGSSFKY